MRLNDVNRARFAPLLGRYGFAVVAVGLALIHKLMLEPVLGDESPFLLFLAAVTITAWYGGIGPGVVATVGASLVSAYFFSLFTRICTTACGHGGAEHEEEHRFRN